MRTVDTSTGIEHLALDECLRLLGSQEVGRVGFVRDDQPLVLPVNYAVHGDVLVFRTGRGTKLDLVPQAKVAFEVDGFEPSTRSGWSVVVQGVAREITAAADVYSEGLRQGTGPSWAPGTKDHYVAITPRVVSGRRFGVAAADEGVAPSP